MDSIKKMYNNASKKDVFVGGCAILILGIILLAAWFQTAFGDESQLEENGNNCMDNEFVWGSLYALAGSMAIFLMYFRIKEKNV